MIDHDPASTTRSRTDRLASGASDLQSDVFRKVAAPQVHPRKTGNRWRANWGDFVVIQLRAQQCQCWDQCVHYPSRHE